MRVSRADGRAAWTARKSRPGPYKVAAAEPGGVSDEHATLDEFVDPGTTDEQSSGGAESSAGAASPDEAPPSDDAAAEATPTDAAAGTPTDDAASEPPPDDAPAGTATISEAVDPAESTYRWSGAGARCDGCGAHVERLWRDEAGLVCGDCKEW